MPPNQELLDHRRQGRALDVAELQALAKFMDSAFVVPGLNVRFGVDALLGLFPGLGDVASTMVSLYILHAAHQRGVSRVTLARMASNLVLDGAVGSIPLVGDVFDVYWKSNNRNVELLRQHVQALDTGRRRTTWGDWLFFAGLAGLLGLILIGSLTATYFVFTTLAALIRS